MARLAETRQTALYQVVQRWHLQRYLLYGRRPQLQLVEDQLRTIDRFEHPRRWIDDRKRAKRHADQWRNGLCIVSNNGTLAGAQAGVSVLTSLYVSNRWLQPMPREIS